jgi:hypothetical protein
MHFVNIKGIVTGPFATPSLFFIPSFVSGDLTITPERLIEESTSASSTETGGHQGRG